MQENSEAWDLEVTIALPETIPGTQERFRKALRAALSDRYSDFQGRFLRQLSDSGHNWTEPPPYIEAWQFEASGDDEIKVNSVEKTFKTRNYISVSDARLWELLVSGLAGELDVYFDSPPEIDEIDVLNLKVLITVQIREALPEEEVVNFRCEQEGVEYVTLRVSCSRSGTQSKTIRAPSCASSEDLSVFLKEVFHVAPEIQAEVTLKTPETDPDRLVRLQSPVPLYRYLSWSGAALTELSPAASDLASRFQAALDL